MNQIQKAFRDSRIQDILMHTYGVDVGNYATKTRHCEFTSGFSISRVNNGLTENFLKLSVPDNTKPFSFKDSVILNNGTELKNLYYCLSNTPVPYNRVKTDTEDMFILTLHAIAKEAIARGMTLTKGEKINLLVGTPTLYFTGETKKRYKSYYLERGKRVVFEYSDRPFDFSIESVKVYAQCFSAAIDAPDLLAQGKVQFIDIGGITTDKLITINGTIDPDSIDSIEQGCNQLCKSISVSLITEHSISMKIPDIVRMLNGEASEYPDELINLVHDIAYQWLANLLLQIESEGYDFKYTHTVVFGGGVSLLKQEFNRFINERKAKLFTIINNTKANALGYERFAALNAKELSPAITDQEFTAFWKQFDMTHVV